MGDEIYMPDPFMNELEELLDKLNKDNEKLCVCALNDLMAQGCTCGAIIIERKLRARRKE